MPRIVFPDLLNDCCNDTLAENSNSLSHTKLDAISHLLGFSETEADCVSGWWVHSQQYYFARMSQSVPSQLPLT